MSDTHLGEVKLIQGIEISQAAGSEEEQKQEYPPILDAGHIRLGDPLASREELKFSAQEKTKSAYGLANMDVKSEISLQRKERLPFRTQKSMPRVCRKLSESELARTQMPKKKLHIALAEQEKTSGTNHNSGGRGLQFRRHSSLTARSKSNYEGEDTPRPKNWCKYMMELPREGKLVVTVSDTGCGIDDEGKKRLFQVFSQADKSVYGKYGGTGLGLWLAQKLLNAMNGQIELESTLGVGTTFKITIPTHCRAFPDSVQVRRRSLPNVEEH